MKVDKQARYRTEWNRHIYGLSEFCESAAVSAFGQERSVERNQKLIRKIMLVEDSNIANSLATLEQYPPDRRAELSPRCTLGCSHCCYQWVRLTVPEVLFVGEYVRENFSDEEIEGLKESCRIYIDEFHKVPPKTRSSIACPLLKNDLCSVYKARPIICRGVASLDAEKCYEGKLNPDSPVLIPIIKPMLEIACALRQGVTKGLAGAQLESYEVVLGIALLVVLEDPKAGEKYFAGENVFEVARAPEDFAPPAPDLDR